MLFTNMHLLFGSIAEHWQVVVFEDYKGFLLAILPPGAFLVLGLLIALKNWIDRYYTEHLAKTAEVVAPTASRRVRVTGAVD